MADSVQSIPKFEFKSALKNQPSDCQVGLDLGENSEGPVAMMYEVDVTRKLIRGRKINIVGEEARWVHFKYERLPNFCYRCGLLEHDLRECPDSVGRDKAEGKEDLQYGAWLRGEPTR